VNNRLANRQQSVPFCNVTYAARHPCALLQGNTRNNATSVASRAMKTVSERLLTAVEPVPKTALDSPHGQQAHRDTVENT
jgi:hypothetical protein